MTNDSKDAALNPTGDPAPVAADVPVFPPPPMNVAQGTAERFPALPNARTRSKGSGKAGGKGVVGKTISRGNSYTPTTSSTPKNKKRKVGKKKAFKISGVFLGGQASRKTATRKFVARKRYRGK